MICELSLVNWELVEASEINQAADSGIGMMDPPSMLELCFCSLYDCIPMISRLPVQLYAGHSQILAFSILFYVHYSFASMQL